MRVYEGMGIAGALAVGVMGMQLLSQPSKPYSGTMVRVGRYLLHDVDGEDPIVDVVRDAADRSRVLYTRQDWKPGIHGHLTPELQAEADALYRQHNHFDFQLDSRHE